MESFERRHIGPNQAEQSAMLSALQLKSLDELSEKAVPASIRSQRAFKGLEYAISEYEILRELRKLADSNVKATSFIGMGYYGTLTPLVILRNVLENPGWYTQYTPYQSEIAQGRLEALLNFQTLVSDLTGLEVSNASLLDEATAAAEAMHMIFAIQGRDAQKEFVIASDCHPQTIDVVRTRAEPLGIKIRIVDTATFKPTAQTMGLLLQNPGTWGDVKDYSKLISETKAVGAMTAMACDPLALCLMKTPGEMGADIAFGSLQRFGVPMGFGGPHAAFFSTKDDHKRVMPGRVVGVSKDVEGKPAIRLALQTREQHIRREKATSNICTAQVLLAIMASMYAVYHGPKGLKKIALDSMGKAEWFRSELQKLGVTVCHQNIFDTVCLTLDAKRGQEILQKFEALNILCRHEKKSDGSMCLAFSFDESITKEQMLQVLTPFGAASSSAGIDPAQLKIAFPRKAELLTHPVFSRYHSETEMLRYITRLQSRDLSLANSMIPLGSCTMKLNATAEMIPVTWEGFSNVHPFTDAFASSHKHTQGYREMLTRLEGFLCEILGFDAVSLQPNAGSQGEYAGLLAIRKYHQSRNEGHRNVCLIPQSAHGTNPASAAMAGMQVVVVACDKEGNVDLKDLEVKTKEHGKNLSNLMITYPSTHGVFEEDIKKICELVHAQGGQVYMDGANLNAQVGLCRPAEFGADVLHVNLHKTFCIPHGGGGPGMGPIGVKKHLAPFLPGHSVVKLPGQGGAVSAAPWGSASILPISYSYMRMMGTEGMRHATQVAILNANYIAKALDPHYPVLYKGTRGSVAHECILDCRPFKTAGIEVEDIAKRLIDYGFHAPTVSFPVPGTMMVEPTESESKEELDRFIDAMVKIRFEIQEIQDGKMDPKNNLLKNAPHSAESLLKEPWTRPYTRERAAYPAPWVKERKFWPYVSRIDNVYGDRNLICSCPPIEDYA